MPNRDGDNEHTKVASHMSGQESWEHAVLEKRGKVEKRVSEL